MAPNFKYDKNVEIKTLDVYDFQEEDEIPFFIGSSRTGRRLENNVFFSVIKENNNKNKVYAILHFFKRNLRFFVRNIKVQLFFMLSYVIIKCMLKHI